MTKDGPEQMQAGSRAETSCGVSSLLRTASAAAAAAVVAAAVMVWPRPSASTYAVIDGKVCTDRSEVRAEALSALQTIQLEDDDDAFAALGMMERQ